jgi:hypothetical protein
MAEIALAPVVIRLVARRIAAQGQDVGHAGGGVALENRRYFGPAVAHAGEVRHRWNGGGLFDAHHQIVGHLAGGAAGPVSHGDK